MAGKIYSLRGADGRFAAGGGRGRKDQRETELKRGRGDRASGRAQIRRKHRNALTAKDRRTFLETLAVTCNVSAAARATGRHCRSFYDLRRREAGFRVSWGEALVEGYAYLELELLNRARFGVKKDVFHAGAKTATTRVYQDGTALRLLHLHRATVSAMRERDDETRRHPDDVFAEIVRRMAEIEALEEGGETGATGGAGRAGNAE